MAHTYTRTSTVEAVQLTWDNWNEVCDFVPFKDFGGGLHLHANRRKAEIGETNRLGLRLRLNNSLELSIAAENDWLIKDDDGMHICRPDTFEREYERTT